MLNPEYSRAWEVVVGILLVLCCYTVGPAVTALLFAATFGRDV